MPHLRGRFLEVLIRKDLSWSRVVSVLGMRQSGKTTLLRKICKSYITLDDAETLRSFQKGDWHRLENANLPLVIDEAQLLPELFNKLKILVDQSNEPGQFLLTGSVRFLSRKHIRESLTGRTSILELMPLSLAECHD